MVSLSTEVDALLSSVRLDEYCERRPQLFPSVMAVRWFVRDNKARLIEADALLMHGGRLRIVPDRMDRAVAEIAASAIRRRASLDDAKTRDATTGAPGPLRGQQLIR